MQLEFRPRQVNEEFLMSKKKKNNLSFDSETQLSSSEIKTIEVYILEQFISFCKKENIKVFIGYGTLIGAVRHKDFIPWDDDIDVIIPRRDYERLINLSKEKKVAGDIDFLCYENTGWNYPFAKLVKNDTYIRTKDSPYHHGIWVDVFPLDNVKSRNDKVLKRSRKLRAIILAKMYKPDKHLFTIHGLAKILIKVLTVFIPTRFFTKKLVETCKMYDDTERFFSNISWGYGPKDVFDKEDLEHSTELTFNRLNVPAMANYKEHLSFIYGDYMSLPPVEKRKTHGFDAWKMKE